MESVFSFESIVFPNKPDHCFRFILRNSASCSEIWFEDKFSKNQWSCRFDDEDFIRTFIKNAGIIRRQPLMQYLQSSLEALDEIHGKGNSETQRLELFFREDANTTIKMTLLVGHGCIIELEYKFEMTAVKLTTMDILESKLRDAMAAIDNLKGQLESLTPYTGPSFYAESMSVTADRRHGIPQHSFIKWTTDGSDSYSCHAIQIVNKDEIHFYAEQPCVGCDFPVYKIEFKRSMISVNKFICTTIPDIIESSFTPLSGELTEIKEEDAHKYGDFHQTIMNWFVIKDTYSDKDAGTHLVLKIKNQGESIPPQSGHHGQTCLFLPNFDMLITRIA